MNSLVTGGAGFIGRHLVQRLLEHGDRVRVLDIGEAGALTRHAEVVRGSVCDPSVVRAAMNGMHRVFHLAANPELWARRKRDFHETNVVGTRVLLEEAARHDLERIVHTSTESILASASRTTGLVNEEAQPVLEEMPGPYCRSKLLAEQAAWEAARRGQPVVIVSPTLPVGPGDYRLTPPTRMLVDLLNGTIPAYLDFRMNLVDVRDAAAGHLLAAQRGQVGRRYILGGTNIRLGELIDCLRDLTGFSMPRRRIPYWLALAVAAVAEVTADLVTRRRPAAPLAGVRLARHSMAFDSSRAERELGLPMRPLRESLADAVAWLAAEGRIVRDLTKESVQAM
jgi:dihydroflavonol-4-reductase